jgi:hypothetical protein
MAVSSGGKTFATADKRERLMAASQRFRWVTIHIDVGATGPVYIGNYNVSSVAASRAGMPLHVISSIGDAVRFQNVDLFDVWAASGTADDRVIWTGELDE